MKKYTKRQNEIITIAMKLVAEGGIQKLTVNNIAQEIGITEPAIYRHFDSKIDILLGIMDKFDNDLKRLFENLQKNTESNLEKIKKFYEFHLNNFNQKPYMASVLFAEDIFRDDKRLSNRVYKIMQKNQKNILHVIKDASAKGELREDIEPPQIMLLIMGPLRLLVKKWQLSDYNFDLVKKGNLLFTNIHKVIKK